MKMLLNIVLNTTGGFFRAFVFLKFFNWFVAPQFNLDQLNFWAAYAAILTINILRMKSNVVEIHYRKKHEDTAYWINQDLIKSFSMIAALSFVLFVGWIATLFIN